MPKVEKFQRRVPIAPLRGGMLNTRVTPQSQGKGIGDTVAAVGLSMYRDEVNKQNDLAFMSAVREMSTRENLLLHDPEQGAYATKGPDSMQAHDVALTNLDDFADTLHTGLRNDQQKMRFEAYWTNRRNDVSKGLLKHTATQMELFDTEQTNEFVKQAQRNAAQNFSDPTRVTQEAENIKSAISAYGSRAGKSSQWIENTQFQSVSKLHTQVLDHMIARQMDIQAKEYKARNFENMTHEDAVRVTQWLESANVEGQAQRMADDIWLLGKDRVDHYRMIEEMTEGMGARGAQVRSAAEARIDKMHANANIALDESREMITNAMTFQLEASGGDMRSIMNMDQWSQLDRGSKSALMSYANALASGVQIKTDMNEYYRLISWASADETRDGFAKLNLMKWRPLLDDDDFKAMVKLQADVREGLTEDSQGLITNTSRQNDMTDDALLELGITEKDDPKRIGKFRREMRNRVRRHEKITQQPITDEALQELIDTMTQDVVKKREWLWDTDQSAYEMEVDDVPEDATAKIRIAWQEQNGRAPTDEEITQVYADFLRTESNRQEREAAEKAEQDARTRLRLIEPEPKAERSPEERVIEYDPSAQYEEHKPAPGHTMPIEAVPLEPEPETIYGAELKLWKDNMSAIARQIAQLEDQMATMDIYEIGPDAKDSKSAHQLRNNDLEAYNALKSQVITLRREYESLAEQKPLK